jgi:hypothetical protein
MSSKIQSYILATIVTIIAGVGMMSTGIAAMATTNDSPTYYGASRAGANNNNNENSNINTNTVYVGPQYQQQQHVAQVPQYQYQPPYYTPPAPVYMPPVYEYSEAPGIPNTGLGGLAGVNLIILLVSGLFVAAGIAYVFPWSKQNVKYS